MALSLQDLASLTQRPHGNQDSGTPAPVASTSKAVAEAAPPPDSSGTFEFYDPRGLFTRRRQSTTSRSDGSSAAGKSPASSIGRRTVGTPAGARAVETSPKTSSLSSSTSSLPVIQDARTNAPVTISPSPAPSSPINIPSSSSSPHYTHQSQSGAAADRGRLSRLHIGGERPKSGTTLASASSTSIATPRPPEYTRSTSIASTSSSRHSRSNSIYEEDERSDEPFGRASSSSILSPAAEFLGSFSASSSVVHRGRSDTSTSIANGTPSKASGFLASSWSRTQNEIPRSFIAPDPDEDGEIVDGYVLEKLIGTGTFSTVKRARDLETGEKVAVKIVRHANNGGAVAGSGMAFAQHDPYMQNRGLAEDRNERQGLGRTRSEVGRSPATQRDRQTEPGSRSSNKGQDGENRPSGHRPTPVETRIKFGRNRSCSSPVMPLGPTFEHRWQEEEAAEAARQADSAMAGPASSLPEGLPQSSSSYSLIDKAGFGDDEEPLDAHMQSPSGFSDSDLLPPPSSTRAQHGLLASRADASLQREIAIWSRLSHRHIVPLLHMHEDDFATFVFMPLCRGGNLLKYVKEWGRGGPAEQRARQRQQPPEQDNENVLTVESERHVPHPRMAMSMSPPKRTAGSEILARKTSITNRLSEDARSQSNLGRSVSLHNKSSGPTAPSKPVRSASIRLRQPGEVVQGGSGLPLASVKKIFAQVVSGLAYLHLEANVTHKDIKLENILLDLDVDDSDDAQDELMDDGGEEKDGAQGGIFRISDFGLAHGPDHFSPTTAFAGFRGRQNGRARRENALSDGDVPLTTAQRPGIGAGIKAGGVPFPSLGEMSSSMIGAGAPALDALAFSTPSIGTVGSPPPISDAERMASPNTLLHRSTSMSAPRHAATATSSGASASSMSLAPSALAFNQAAADAATAGSLQYTSPEQIKSPAPVTDASVDIWALGCVLYAMIEGRLPFDDGFEPRLRVNIMKGEWKWPSALLLSSGQKPEISAESSDDENLADEEDREKLRISKVLQGCLEVDPAQRWTIAQVADSAWLKEAMETLALQSPIAPSSDSVPSFLSMMSSPPTAHPSRGRKRSSEGLTLGRQVPSEDGGDLDSASADRRSEDGSSRSRSRGRPSLARTHSSSLQQQQLSRPASQRRGPSQDEYRRAREGDSGRSRSRSSRNTSRTRYADGGRRTDDANDRSESRGRQAEFSSKGWEII